MTNDRAQFTTPYVLVLVAVLITILYILASVVGGVLSVQLPTTGKLPSIGGNISALEAGMTIAIFAAGYVLHEALHLVPVKAWGITHETAVLPRDDGEPWPIALLFGTVYEIRLTDDIPHWKVVVVALAPLAMIPVPLAALALMLQYPVIDLGTLLVVFAWFAVSTPSLADLLSAFGRYEHARPTLQGGEHGQ